MSSGPPALISPDMPASAPGEVLIQFGGADPAARGLALASVRGRVLEVIRTGSGADGLDGALVRVALGGDMAPAQAVEAVSSLAGVRFAEPNYILSVAATSNDPGYVNGQLWGMYGDQTSPVNAYGSQAGEAWASGAVGSTKVAVGVIDTGFDYTHPELYQNIWLNQGEISTTLKASLVDGDGDGLITFRDLNQAANAALVSDLNGNGRIDAGDLLADARWENGLDEDANGYRDDLVGWDFVNGDNDPYDDNNHGTHVSGTIGAAGGNGTGVAGVAWAVEIAGLKFLSASGSGYLSAAVQAIDYFTGAAQRASGIDFVATNNSWGGGGYSQSLADAITRSALKDILFVAAAGNGGSDGVGDNNDVAANYPSNYGTAATAGFEAVVAVAAINSAGSLSSFSNYGAGTVDLGAPGQAIYSTLPGGGYGSYSGTSMATPHVTGAIAVYAAANPGASAAQIRADLLGSATATASLAGKTVSGGRLDVSAFLAKAGDSSGTTPLPQPNLIYGTSGGETIVGTSGADKIWGVPASGAAPGRGSIDTLYGSGGADVFVFGDSRGRFYDDGKSGSAGTGDYAVVMDFGADDRIQLAGGAAKYFQTAARLNGVSGMGLYFDTNASGRFDSKDELIGLVANAAAPLDNSLFLFV